MEMSPWISPWWNHMGKGFWRCQEISRFWCHNDLLLNLLRIHVNIVNIYWELHGNYPKTREPDENFTRGVAQSWNPWNPWDFTKSQGDREELQMSLVTQRNENWSHPNREMGLSENVVYPKKPNGFADHEIPTKWLFHWGYTPFSDIPKLPSDLGLHPRKSTNGL